MFLTPLQLPENALVQVLADTHLHASDSATFMAWQNCLQSSVADAIILLGDIFEVWVGDDWGLQDPFALQCAAVLRQTSAKRPLYFIHGNRDFLLGSAFAQHCGVQILADPCVLAIGAKRTLLSHGDAWVTADAPYQAFRQLARSSAWQREFLARPLAERVALGAAMRAQSQAAQAGRSHYDDIDFALALDAMRQADTPTLLHGHTHRPSCDALDAQHQRWVLSDWDAQQKRGDYFLISTAGIERKTVQF
jgi:UDP-2,3-diacylglucosamine hydrolase